MGSWGARLTVQALYTRASAPAWAWSCLSPFPPSPPPFAPSLLTSHFKLLTFSLFFSLPALIASRNPDPVALGPRDRGQRASGRSPSVPKRRRIGSSSGSRRTQRTWGSAAGRASGGSFRGRMRSAKRRSGRPLRCSLSHHRGDGSRSPARRQFSISTARRGRWQAVPNHYWHVSCSATSCGHELSAARDCAGARRAPFRGQTAMVLGAHDPDRPRHRLRGDVHGCRTAVVRYPPPSNGRVSLRQARQ